MDGRVDGSQPHRRCSWSSRCLSSDALGSLSWVLLGQRGPRDTPPTQHRAQLRFVPSLLYVPCCLWEGSDWQSVCTQQNIRHYATDFKRSKI